MKAKLSKIEPHYFLIVDGKTFGSTMEPHLSASIRHSLSLKNCQAIERGYDLDELADKFSRKFPNDSEPIRYASFILGFQKAVELMCDKKFTEEDVILIAEYIRVASQSTPNVRTKDLFDEYQSLQQNEWEVEILREEVNIGDKYTPDPSPS